MKKYIILILISTTSFILFCDPLLNDWFDTDSSMRDIIWEKIDGGVFSLNVNSAQNATDPAICANNGIIYTAWVEGSNTVYIKKFNDDINYPQWEDITFNINTYLTTPISNISLVSLNGSLFLGCNENMAYRVIRFSDSLWEDYGFATSSLAGKASMKVFAGKIYIAYRDADTYVHALRCDGPFSWPSVDDIYTFGIGDIGNPSDAPDLAATDTALYAAFIESTGFFRLKVRAYNGISWSTISTGFNYSQSVDDNDTEPSVTSGNGKLYISWGQLYNADTQKRLSAWSYRDGMWNRIDGGLDTGIRYYDSLKSLGTTASGIINKRFFVIWFENNTDAPTDDRLRGKIFNEGTDSPAWRSIDNNLPITYNNDQIISFDTIGYDSKIYVVFTEANAAINQVHVMAGY